MAIVKNDGRGQRSIPPDRTDMPLSPQLCRQRACLILIGCIAAVGWGELPSARSQDLIPPPRPSERQAATSNRQVETLRNFDTTTSLPRLTERGSGDESPLINRASRNDAMVEVVIGQGRLLTLERDLVEPNRSSPLIAVGDPSILDFEVVGPRHIRITGQRVGVTDISVVPSSGDAFNVEVHVVADLNFLSARLRQAFPDAVVSLTHLREHVIVEGQARDVRQADQIAQTVVLYLQSTQAARRIQGTVRGGGGPPDLGATAQPQPAVDEGDPDADPSGQLPAGTPGDITADGIRPNIRVEYPAAQVINLLKVPGPQQVLLKVRVAELNRTAVRQLGVNWLFIDSNTAIGQNVGNGLGSASDSGLLGLLNPLNTDATTFGVFDGGSVNFFVEALARNQVFKILAEPTLMAMHGQEASFLSGGEFPVPVPQGGAATGAITIQYREFGVGLTFVPHILDDNTIRLAVAPEVSSIDFTLGISVAGIQVPALNKRSTKTVVELAEGQTLAVSGLLQVELEGTTDRVPGLGDLPHIGPLFRNNSSRRVEKELIILVTPYLVGAMNRDEVPPTPGDEICSPSNRDFYRHGFIEAQSRQPERLVRQRDAKNDPEYRRELESQLLIGPYGYSQ